MAPSLDERMPDPAERKHSLPKRTKSTSSDRSMQMTSPLLSSPGPVTLEAAYLAAASASDIVTSDFYAYYDEEEAELADEPEVVVSPGSLKLVNAFLDHLLWQILAASRSTSLAKLRTAVTEVLKPRLARDAIGGADQELRDYAGGDEDELLDNPDADAFEFDLEETWRRARHQCMIYSSLGDVEEDDEEAAENDERPEKRPGSSANATVPAATAIFLTSILEYLGEFALHAAGDAARQRLMAKLHDLDRASISSSLDEPLVVEESDMEKVALNIHIGRLWRTWRKKLRTPNGSMSRPMSRESNQRRYRHGSITSRRSSVDTNDGVHYNQGITSRKISIEQVPEELYACTIALPMTENDVEEIEIGDWKDLPEDLVQDTPALKRVHSAMFTPINWSYSTALDGDLTPTTTRKMPLPIRLVRSKSFEQPKSKTLLFPEILPTDVPLPPFNAEDYPGEVCDEFEQRPVTVVIVPEAEEEVAEVPTVDEPVKEDSVVEKSEPEPKRSRAGPVVAALAGAGIAGAAVLATAAAAISGKSIETHEAEDELQVSSKPVFDHELDDEPVVIEHASRVSLEGTRTPPEIVETRSRSSSLRSHRSQPSAEANLRRKISFKNTKPSVEVDDPNAIGVARTSDVSIALPSPRSPNFEFPTSPSLGSDMSDQEKRELRNTHRNQFVLSQAPPQPPLPPLPTVAPPQPQSSYQKHRPSPLGDSNLLLAPQAYDRGVPPLTPLREMMEAAVDTSDEASVSSAHSDHEDKPPAPPPKNHMAKTSSSSTSSGSDGHSIYSDDSRKALPFAPSERAGVQRVYTPPATPGTEVVSKARRSESFGRDKRPNTSASNNSNSSVKKRGLMSWGAEPKTSDESISVSEKHSQMVAKNTDTARNFEKLLENDETLQLTLTPQTVREPPGPESPRFAPAARVNTTGSQPDSPRFATLARSQTPRTEEFSKPKASPGLDSAGPIQKTVVTVTRLNGLRSNPPPSPRVTVSQPTILSPPPAKKYIPKSRPPPPSKNKNSGLEARDARPNRASMRDIADFIRRTGPGDRYSFDRSRPNTAKQQKRLSTPVTSTQTTPLLASNEYSLNREPRKAPVKRLEARDAVVSKRDSSSDLVDFIRSGPPGEKPLPRTNRGPSAFRNTMESEQSYEFKDNRASANDKSLNSSYNSATGLLAQTARADNGMPQRKQRRIADPYAIDSDDDDDFMNTPRGFEADETLANFLTSPAPRADSRTANSRALSPGPRTHIPTAAPQLSLAGQSPMLSDSSFNSSGTSTYQPSRGGGGSTSGRSAGTYQPRSGRVDRHSSSNDLAEFLRNSGPPETSQTYSPPAQGDSSIARMFSRTGSKKKNNFENGYSGHSVILS